MSDIFFKTDENFEPIIRKSLEGKEVKSMNLITTGWTNIVYEVETDEGNYFFRFPRDEFWSRTIVKDCEFAQYIYGKTDYTTPDLQLQNDNGRPFSMHKKIPGTPLAEKLNSLSSEEITDIAQDIANFISELHNLEFQKEKIFTINNIGLNLSEFLDELLTKHVSKEDMAFWKFADSEENSNCLVHGDLNTSNILLDENNKVTAIIDFGFAGFGNQYDDLARILSRNCPENFKDAIVSSYENCSQMQIDHKKLDDKITEWGNIDQSYINYMRGIGIYE